MAMDRLMVIFIDAIHHLHLLWRAKCKTSGLCGLEFKEVIYCNHLPFSI